MSARPETAEETFEQVQQLQARIEARDTTVVPELVQRIRKTRDRLMARLLIRVVHELALPEHLRKISKLYHKKDSRVRLWVLATVARLEDYEYFPLLLHGFFYDSSRKVRSACRRTLKRLSQDQLTRLIENMEGHPAPWMQEVAAEARRGLLQEKVPAAPEHAGNCTQELVIEALTGADLGPMVPMVPRIPEPASFDGASFDGAEEPESSFDSKPSEKILKPMPAQDELVLSSGLPEAPESSEDAFELPGEDDFPEEEGDGNADPEATGRRRRRSKSRSALGIVEAISLQDKEGQDRTFSRRYCPECGEKIMVVALVCRYCQTVFDPEGLEGVMEAARVRVIPLPVRSPSHRGSALVIDLCLSALLFPVAGLGLVYLLAKDSLGQGASLGKRLYNLQVLHGETGEPCTLRSSVLRNLSLLVPLLPMVEVVLLSATGLRLGDRAGETRVVFTEDPPATALLASASLAMLSVASLILVVVFHLASLRKGG